MTTTVQPASFVHENQMETPPKYDSMLFNLSKITFYQKYILSEYIFIHRQRNSIDRKYNHVYMIPNMVTMARLLKGKRRQISECSCRK